MQQYPVAAGGADRLSPSTRSCDHGPHLLSSGNYSVDRIAASRGSSRSATHAKKRRGRLGYGSSHMVWRSMVLLVAF